MQLRILRYGIKHIAGFFNSQMPFLYFLTVENKTTMKTFSFPNQFDIEETQQQNHLLFSKKKRRWFKTISGKNLKKKCILCKRNKTFTLISRRKSKKKEKSISVKGIVARKKKDWLPLLKSLFNELIGNQRLMYHTVYFLYLRKKLLKKCRQMNFKEKKIS